MPLFETSQFSLPNVLEVLSNLRINVIDYEFELHDFVASILKEHSFPFEKEVRLGPRNRIDFLVEGGVGIEVKKGKPNQNQVISQITRYTRYNQISAIVLVVERNLDLPKEINGKPCVSFGLNKLWGIAL